jgi:hypothetical protein
LKVTTLLVQGAILFSTQALRQFGQKTNQILKLAFIDTIENSSHGYWILGNFLPLDGIYYQNEDQLDPGAASKSTPRIGNQGKSQFWIGAHFNGGCKKK